MRVLLGTPLCSLEVALAGNARTSGGTAAGLRNAVLGSCWVVGVLRNTLVGSRDHRSPYQTGHGPGHVHECDPTHPDSARHDRDRAHNHENVAELDTSRHDYDHVRYPTKIHRVVGRRRRQTHVPRRT